MRLKSLAVDVLRRCPLALQTTSRLYYTVNRSFMTLSPGVPQALVQAFEQVQASRGGVGDYYEFGVFRGYAFWSAFDVCRNLGLTATRFHGFDSFSGLPVPEAGEDVRGQFFKGQFACLKEEVVQHLTAHGVDWNRAELIPGFFNETLTDDLKASRPFGPVAVALIDCDLYSSTRDVLRWLSGLITDGSVLLFDDWRALDDPDLGQQLALKEFLASNPRWRVEPFVDYPPHGTSFIVRNSQEFREQSAYLDLQPHND